MPTIGSGQIEVGTDVTLIVPTDPDGQRAHVKNLSTERAIFLGGSAVTTTTGFKLKLGEELSLFLGPGEAIYGIVVTGTASACYLATLNQ